MDNEINNELTDMYLDIDETNEIEHDVIKLYINNLDNNNYVNSIINSKIFQDYIQKMNEVDSKLENAQNLDDNNNLETLKTQIIDLIKKSCKHNWVRDYIDIDPEYSQPIIYCTLCEATKK